MSSSDDKPSVPMPGPAREDHVYGKPPGAGDWKRITRIGGLGVLIVYALFFFLMNRETVEINLVVTTASIPLIWVLVGVFVLGALVMYLAQLLLRRRHGGRQSKAGK